MCALCAHSLAEPASWLLVACALPAAAVAASPNGVASYCRFSSKNQDDRTIADQQRQCKARATRDGFASSAILLFADEAVSGAKHSREGFDCMMAAARAGKIKVLYFVNLSRLARDCVLTLQTLRELVYVHKIRVISIDEGIDTSQTDNWELIAAILGVQHEQFLKKLAQDVFRGQEGVVLDNFCVGDYCFGFASEPVAGPERRGKGRNKKSKTRYIKEWDEVAWVVKIFYWFVVERRSIRWIARELNRLGAPKDHRSTTPHWHHQLVTSLLGNRKYIGWWPWGENKNVRDPMTRKIHQEKRSVAETEKWIRHFPDLQIIDDEIFAKAQELLEENAKRHTNHRHANGQLRGSSQGSQDVHPSHLLSGLMKSECGRNLNVGGANGKYLFCRGYGMGVCECQTTLNRELAERLILQAIGHQIASNSTWVELLLSATIRSHEKLKRELPDQRRTLNDALTEVNRRIAMLVANSEQQIVPELESRMVELRTERQRLQADLKQLGDGDQADGPPTKAWIEEKLSGLHLIMDNRGPAAAHALRALVGGKISVQEVRLPGKKRHYLRGRLELQLRAVAESIGARVNDELDSKPHCTEVIYIDFRKPERHELIADEVKGYWDKGLTDLEIAEIFRCGRALISRALDHWYKTRGLLRPDGRTCKKRLKGRRKAEKLQAQIMELWHQDLSVTAISEQLNCGMEIVHEAVTKWHVDRSLPVPDGRARRREIRRSAKRAEQSQQPWQSSSMGSSNR